MPRLELRLPPELHDDLLRHKPKSLSMATFCAFLLEQQTLGLDSASKLPAYRVGAGTPQINGFSDLPAFDPELGRSGSAASAEARAVEAVPPEIDQALEPKKKQGSSSAKRTPHSVKAISSDLVPEDLLDCQQLLPEFWAVKKGTRSEGVWNRVCNKLRQWTPDQRREALERAIASGWGDVFEPPTLKAAAASTGYVDSITRDRQVMDSFLAMFPNEPEAA